MADVPLSSTTGSQRNRTWLPLAVLIALLAIVALVRLYIGSSSFGWPTGPYADEIWRARLFRLTLGAVVGIALSVSGVSLQALLRNPLAEPYILGLSTGAGAGIMAQSLLLYWLGMHLGPSHMGAIVGAAVSMTVVFLASRRRGMIDPLGLLLTGVVLSTINGALIMLFNYLVGPGGIRDDLARWMMGYLNEGVSIQTVGLVAALTLAGLLILLKLGPAMDVATLSEGEARSLGVHLARLRTVMFLTASILAAGAVVLAGPIAFVGLISPHVARLMMGPRHRPLLLASSVAGAALVLSADVVSSLIALSPRFGLMPIGIFTAMVGGPVFLWMLHPRLGRSET